MIMGRNYRELTQDEWVELERLYPTTRNSELAQMFDITVDMLSKKIASPRGWKKDLKAVHVRATQRRKMTDDEMAWLMKHYKHTKNSEIMARFGISDCKLHYLAKKHGLKKSKQFLFKVRSNACKIARDVCRELGIYEETDERMRRLQKERKAKGLKPQGGFREGQSLKTQMSSERFSEMMTRIHQKRNETIRKERLRLRWGLPQKTKMKLHHYGVDNEMRRRSMYRYLFRKRGYIVERGDNVVYYDDTTKRRPRMEANAPNYGLRVMPWEDEHESLG